MTKKSYLVWPAVLLTTFGLMASCGGNGSSGDGDGDGDGDMGDGDAGDGDGAGGEMNGGGQGGAGDCPKECPSDNNPCTEDVCNPDTGECGIPRTGNACDDGIYCNGDDKCDEGECTDHAGDPCEDTSCNEGKKACECSQVEHCPGQDLSDHKYGEAEEWGTVDVDEECTFDDVCDESCSCSIKKTTYACDGGTCMPTEDSFVDSECDVRETDGETCPTDGNACNGTEECKTGNCMPKASTAPVCTGEGTEYCDTTGTDTYVCGECSENAHCTAGEVCCSGVCKVPDKFGFCPLEVADVSADFTSP